MFQFLHRSVQLEAESRSSYRLRGERRKSGIMMKKGGEKWLKERWIEHDLLNLPAGELDWFERKSGALLDKNKGDFLNSIAKELSALANSGGGYLVVGVKDDGKFDGVPEFQGKTPTREWFEQQIPNLTSYALPRFNVHQVEPASPSEIPQGKVIIAVDVPDSEAAPHQSARDHKYYRRSGGHSVVAEHFYLELLRQRLLTPVLDAEPTHFDVVDAFSPEEFQEHVFVETRITFTVKNRGQVAAYKWQLKLVELAGNTDEMNIKEVLCDKSLFPTRPSRVHSIPMGDSTILPTLGFQSHHDVGFLFSCADKQSVAASLKALFQSFILVGHVVGEAHVGASCDFDVGEVINADAVVADVLGRLKRQT